jgi:hypothetical protein
MHQGLVGCAWPECWYNVSVADPGEFVAFLGEMLDVTPNVNPDVMPDAIPCPL